MNKATLVKKIMAASGQPEAVVRSVIDSTTAIITTSLAALEEPYGLGLGKFSVVTRPPKKARDIRRGTAVDVPARNVVIFRPSKPLAEAVNGKREL